MADAVTPEAIRRAAGRLAGRVRRTPLMPAGPLVAGPEFPGELFLKLECLQVTGSFKARGALNRALALDEPPRGLVTASGGNHGLGVAFAAGRLGLPATVFLPARVSERKVGALRALGAAVEVGGEDFDQAAEAAMALAARDGLVYVHAFADPEVVAGQGTIGIELLEDLPDADTALIAVGGGGLIGGVATMLKAARPGMRVVGIEPVGAPTLHDSLEAGGLVTLERIDTAAGSLSPRRSAPLNLDLARAFVDRILLVDDEEMRQAARRLWNEAGIATELAGAAAFAALDSGRYRPEEGERVVAVVCAAGLDGLG